MRKYKFRAWDKIGLKMYDVASIDFKASNIEVLLANNKTKGLALSEVSLIQFTGLKDRNNVEIFEGYIVSYKYTQWNQGTQPPTYSKVNDISAVCYEELSDEIGRPYIGFTMLGNMQDIEVIGNIYESPNLVDTKGIN